MIQTDVIKEERCILAALFFYYITQHELSVLNNNNQLRILCPNRVFNGLI